MSFKLLAIRPLTGCDKSFLKNLNPGQIYSLYHNYSFHASNQDKINLTANDKVCFISKSASPPEIYRTTTADEHNLAISVSAIAGKNGSGKSSLIELFFASIYLYCAKKNILEPNLDSLRKDFKNVEKALSLNEKQSTNIIKERADIVKGLSD